MARLKLKRKASTHQFYIVFKLLLKKTKISTHIENQFWSVLFHIKKWADFESERNLRFGTILFDLIHIFIYSILGSAGRAEPFKYPSRPPGISGVPKWYELKNHCRNHDHLDAITRRITNVAQILWTRRPGDSTKDQRRRLLTTWLHESNPAIIGSCRI